MIDEPKNLAYYCTNESCGNHLPKDARDVKPQPYRCILCGFPLMSYRFGQLEPDELRARVAELEGERAAVLAFLRQKATDTSNRTGHRVLAKAARQIERGAHRKQGA